jgi:MFS family permease
MEQGIQHNAQRLLWAGFMAILAAGVGFSIRSGILQDWGSDFGFSQGELGKITGGGLTGFGIIILIGALVADRIGYGRLMVFAFIMHLLSAGLTLAAPSIFSAYQESNPDLAKSYAYQCLFWGTFLFAVGNGTAEAVVNPLVATLFPRNKTHYLNILHAGWPGGLVIGGLASYFMVSAKVKWEVQFAMFLIPTVLYGVMLLGQRFPKSEASVLGVSYRDMLKEIGMLGAAVICLLLGLFFISDLQLEQRFGESTGQIVGWGAALGLWVLFGVVTGFHLGPAMLAFLLVIHAMVGYVELGTDSWISNITGSILTSRGNGLLLFVYTSSLMFALRFFAGPIVHKISPLGLLFVSSCFGALGLWLLGGAMSGVMCVVAATVYAIGKTYFWPTMLGVVSERFPKGGAITIGTIGGVGMLSAGLLGGPGIGYKQDYFASQQLQAEAPSVYEDYKSPAASGFLFFPKINGLDNTKVGAIREMPADERNPAEQQVYDASLHGGRMALKVTALIPVTMGVCYLLLVLYFQTQGGYKVVHLSDEHQ